MFNDIVYVYKGKSGIISSLGIQDFTSEINILRVTKCFLRLLSHVPKQVQGQP